MRHQTAIKNRIQTQNENGCAFFFVQIVTQHFVNDHDFSNALCSRRPLLHEINYCRKLFTATLLWRI